MNGKFVANSTSKETSFNREEKISININPKPQLSYLYHRSEIDQNKMVITNAVVMIWIGIAMLVAGMILSIFKEFNFLMIVSGAFIDLFSGTMIYLVNKSSETKQKYFENLSVMEHEEKIIDLIKSSDDQSFKDEMIAKLVDKL